MTVQFELSVVPGKLSKKTTLALSPNTDIGHKEETVPVLQIEGSEVSELVASVSLAHPELE
jgi:hypothetical protein